MSDPDLVAARETSSAALYGSIGGAPLAPGDDPRRAAVAGWALVHGLATLYLDGNLPPELGDDPRAIARDLAAHLFTRS